MKAFLPFFPLIKKFQSYFIGGVLLILLGTTIEIFLPLIIGKTVDAVTAHASNGEIFYYGKIFLSLIVLRAIAEAIQGYVIQRTGQKVLHDLRLMVFDKILRLPVAYFDANSTGRLMTRLMNDIKSVSELFSASISVLILDTAVIVGTVVAMLYSSFYLSLWILLTFPIAIYLIFYFGNRLATAYREVRQNLSQLNSFIGENVGAIASIHRLGAEEDRQNGFEERVQKHTDTQFKSVHIFALSQPVIGFFNGVSIATLLGLGGYWVIEGKMTLGVLVMFLGYLRNLFQPIRDLIEKYNTFLSSYVSLERINQILFEKEENPAGVEIQEMSDSIFLRFDSVNFQYPGRDISVLKDISFDLQKGKRIAIVGSTGSGKSSIIRLILRFYEPTSGAITLFGEKISNLALNSYRSVFGFVPQEVYVFHGSIRENLTLGRLEISDESLIKISKQSGLWKVIENRGGLNFETLEGGGNLSMGEKQLLCLTRVLVLDPKVLILDEATSNIDSNLESQIVTAIETSLVGRTSIIIAHRLSTIMRCDEILVMENGQIAERGTFTQLRSQNGLFEKFCKIYDSTPA